MKLIIQIAFPLFALFQSCISVTTDDHSKAYDGVKVVRVPTGKSTSKLDALIQRLKLTTWTHASHPNSHVDVEVPLASYGLFISSVETILNDDGVLYPVEVMHADLGASIRQEAEGLIDAKESAAQGELANQAWFNAYHPYNDHLTWLDDLVAAFPDNAKIVSSGSSVEGRDIKGVNIFGASGSGAKPAVVWHGNVHAREWITSMTVEYLAHALLNNYANSTEVKAYVDKYDFYVFPIVNPDGFVYTQTQERLWRKNRQVPPPQSQCYGRDLNRNWNVSWTAPSYGASDDPCAGDFRGIAPFDTPEISSLSSFLNARAASPAGAAMFVDWHSYSQFFLYPHGYDCDRNVTDSDELERLASGFAGAVRQLYKTDFTFGPSCTTLYPTSGASLDYAFDNLKIKYSFLIELRDTGAHGFILPVSQIRASGEETWEGVKHLLANMVVRVPPSVDTPSNNTTSTPSVPSPARRSATVDYPLYSGIIALLAAYYTLHTRG